MQDAIHKLELDELDPALRTLLRPIAERLGYFGEMFQYLGHAPGPLAAFMGYTTSLRALIPFNLNEISALTTCTLMDFAYERIQHERLSVNQGLSKEWVAAAIGAGDPNLLSETETAVRSLSEAMVQRSKQSRHLLEALSTLTGPTVAIAILMQIARFIEICAIGTVLEPQQPAQSIFE